jgi:CubicO group peptidase (beta-lactamase class C family)
MRFGVIAILLLFFSGIDETASKENQVTFPDKEWLQYRTPEDAGWSSSKLAKARIQSEKDGSSCVLIIYKGAIVQAWGDASRRFILHSARKSTLTALIGIYESKNLISMSSTLQELGIDEVTPLTDIEKQATVKDLITGYSGIYLPSVFGGGKIPERGSDAPGTRWFYNNWNYNALNTIFANQTKRELSDAFATDIAEPLDMEDFRREDGFYKSEKISLHPGYHLKLSSRDWARFGLLYLNNGKWKGKEIVPEAWVKASIKSYAPKEERVGFGYCWSTYPEMNMFASEGSGGHIMMIFPKEQLIIVHRANTYIPKPVDWREIKKLAKLILSAREEERNSIEPNYLIPFKTTGSKKPTMYIADHSVTSRFEKYYDNNGDPVTIKRMNERLIVDIPYLGKFDLYSINDSTFYVWDKEEIIHFKYNSQREPIEAVFAE